MIICNKNSKLWTNSKTHGNKVVEKLPAFLNPAFAKLVPNYPAPFFDELFGSRLPGLPLTHTYV